MHISEVELGLGVRHKDTSAPALFAAGVGVLSRSFDMGQG